MQSSYNVIRNNKAIVNGGKVIETKVPKCEEVLEQEVQVEELKKNYEEEVQKKYEIIGANIINKAKQDAKAILVQATDDAKHIEKEAYETGYQQGKTNGYEDGYNEGYPLAINKGKEEVSVIIDKANELLVGANREFKTYIQDKKEQIINLSFEMAKIIANREFEKDKSILALLEPIIEDCKGEENLVIKCNNKYIEAIKDRISFWKNAYTIKGEIFVLEDPLMDIGNAIVEKKTGKIKVGMDIALEKLEEVIKAQYHGGSHD